MADQFIGLKDDSANPTPTLIEVKNRSLEVMKIVLLVVSSLSTSTRKTETVSERNVSAISIVRFVQLTVDHKQNPPHHLIARPFPFSS